MTATELISRTSELKPNPYNEKLEYFIRALDLRINHELLSESDPVYNSEKLAIGEPYDTLYLLHLFALIDYLNGDWESYENTSAQFNREWKKIAKIFTGKNFGTKRSFKLW